MVVGNTAAQTDVIGDARLSFNVTDAAALANRLVELLREPGWARQLGERALVQAGRSHWNKTADTVLDVLTRANAANTASDLLICGNLIWSQLRILDPACNRVDQLQVGAGIYELGRIEMFQQMSDRTVGLRGSHIGWTCTFSTLGEIRG